MTQQQLVKTCIVCETQKPLSAFLQMTGPKGTVYGHVCNLCRGAEAQLDEKIILTEEESSTSSGLSIDSDARNQAEINDKKHIRDLTEKAREELKLREQLADKKNERINLKEKAEKFHRKTFIDAKKKQSFLNFKDKKLPNTANPSQQHNQAVEAQQQKTAAETHSRQTSIDLSVPTLGLRTDEVRHQSAVFQGFQTWLGANAPIAKAMEKKLAQQAKSAENKSAAQPNDANSNAPTDYANKAWNPSSRRR